MKNYKRYICLILATLLIASSFTGCKGKETLKETEQKPVNGEKYENGLSKDEKVTLRCAFFETGELKVFMDRAMETFTKEYPNVTFDAMFSPNIGDVVRPKISANNDKDMFDIIAVNGLSEGELVKNDKIESLEGLWDMSPQDTPGKTLKDLATSGIYQNRKVTEGETYQLPWGTFVGGLFFDEALFEKNGWNKNPQTWDEFLKLCEDIKETGIAPLIYPGIYAGYLTDYTINPKLFELAEINKNDGFRDKYIVGDKPYYDAPERIEAYTKMSELGKKGYFAKGLAAMDHTQSQMQVLQHKAVMVSVGDWIETEMKTATPEGFKWGYMAMPMREDTKESLYISGGPTDSIYVWKNKPDLTKDWAKQFVLWLWTQDMQKVDAEIGVLSIRNDFNGLDAYSDSKRKISEYISTNKPKMVNSGYSKSWWTDPTAGQADKLVMENLVKMSLGEVDIEELLNKAEVLLDKAREVGTKQ